MLISAQAGIRGVLLDLDRDEPIRKVIWADTERGLFCAYFVDAQGNIQTDAEGNYLYYKAKARLKFIPGKVLTTPPTEPESCEPPPPPGTRRTTVERIRVPLFDLPCENCTRYATWGVSDEVSLPPERKGRILFPRAKVVDVRYYCDWHYKPPRLVDHKGEIITEFHEAGGVRPQW